MKYSKGILPFMLLLLFDPLVGFCEIAKTDKQAYSFIFKKADLQSVTEEILGRTLGLQYRIEPGVQAQINIRIDQKLTNQQLLAIFEAAMMSHDLALVHDNGVYVIKRRKMRL